MHSFKFVAFFLSCLFYINACASAPTKIVKNQVEKYSIESDKKILVIHPKVAFELIGNDKKILEKNHKAREISEWIQKLTIKEMHHLGLNLASSSEDSKKTVRMEPVAKLETSSDILVRSEPKVAALDLLQNICDESMNMAILIQYLRVKIGSDKEWELVGLPPISFSFVPKVKTSSSFLRAVIRDCRTTSTLWKNDAFIREIPSIGSSTFEKAVRQLYRNLSVKSLEKAELKN